MILKGLSGKTYQLAEKPFSSGGEGDIYSITSMPGGVVKVYHADRITQELEEKLLVMCKRPPSREIFAQIAWPVDLAYDLNGAFQGFVMLRLNITDELSAIYAYPPKKNISYKAKVIIAQNICAVISEIHKAGFVFGDFNPKNIGIDLNTCRVAFLDTDSYHIVDGTHTYRCKVCLDGYVAPELLKKCEPYKTDAYARTPLPTFTKETDNFALAIHIFRLLMNGYTPFNGIRESESISTASPGTGNQAIKRDSYCFKPGNKPQSVAVPPLSALPSEIADLFTRAFMYGRIDPTQRPTALEWYKALMNYENSLVHCPNNNAHMYQKGLRSCPWCEADDRYVAETEKPPTRIPSAPSLPQKTFSGAVVPVAPPPAVVAPPVSQPPVGVGYGSTSGAATPVSPPVTQPSVGTGYSSPKNSSSSHGTSGTQSPGFGPSVHSSSGYGVSTSSTSGPIAVGTKRTKKSKRRVGRKRRIIKYVIASVFLIIAISATTAYMAVKNHQQEQYAQAEALLEAGSYSEAAAVFEKLDGYSDAKEQASEIRYQMAENFLNAGDISAAAMAFGMAGDYLNARERSFALWDEIAFRETISAGYLHTVGLKSDGTVVAVGSGTDGNNNVEKWTDIVAVSAGAGNTVGLRSNGTVVAVGSNTDGKNNVEEWTDIVAVSTNRFHTVGLKSDGTVVAVGYNKYDQCNVEDWTDIVAVSAGNLHTVGLKSDGTVVAVGNNDEGQCNVIDWTDIVMVAAGSWYTVGLKSDGTVVAVGNNDEGQSDVGDWMDIVAVSVTVSSGAGPIVGLKSNGTVVTVDKNNLIHYFEKYSVKYWGECDVEDWTDIVAVSAGNIHTVGLKADGTVIAVGNNVEGQCDVSDWSGIKVPNK